MREQSTVSQCTETDCMYNTELICHTPAITVGDECPACDTFIKGKEKAGFEDMIGTVGACKVSSCEFNTALECMAGEIKVGEHGGHPDCLTYRRR